MLRLRAEEFVCLCIVTPELVQPLGAGLEMLWVVLSLRDSTHFLTSSSQKVSLGFRAESYWTVCFLFIHNIMPRPFPGLFSDEERVTHEGVTQRCVSVMACGMLNLLYLSAWSTSLCCLLSPCCLIKEGRGHCLCTWLPAVLWHDGLWCHLAVRPRGSISV